MPSTWVARGGQERDFDAREGGDERDLFRDPVAEHKKVTVR